jgi:hypothetical protein
MDHIIDFDNGKVIDSGNYRKPYTLMQEKIPFNLSKYQLRTKQVQH